MGLSNAFMTLYNNEVSHIQIHNTEYSKNEEINLTIRNPEEITGASIP